LSSMRSIEIALSLERRTFSPLLPTAGGPFITVGPDVTRRHGTNGSSGSSPFPCPVGRLRKSLSHVRVLPLNTVATGSPSYPEGNPRTKFILPPSRRDLLDRGRERTSAALHGGRGARVHALGHGPVGPPFGPGTESTPLPVGVVERDCGWAGGVDVTRDPLRHAMRRGPALDFQSQRWSRRRRGGRYSPA
jgi:hypothetical protein